MNKNNINVTIRYKKKFMQICTINLHNKKKINMITKVIKVRKMLNVYQKKNKNRKKTVIRVDKKFVRL